MLAHSWNMWLPELWLTPSHAEGQAVQPAQTQGAQRGCRLLAPQGRPLSFLVSLVLALPLSLTLVLALPLSFSVSLSLRLSVAPSPSN